MRFVLPLILLALPMGAQEIHHGRGHEHGHEGRSAMQWEKTLERQDREAWQKPDEVVAALALSKGARAADIGAGTGYFSARIAKAIGPEGKVFAVDIQQDLIDYLTERAGKENLPGLTPVLGTPDDPNLAAESVDMIFICDVVHHISNRQDYYGKLAKALRRGGRLVIVDFYKKELPVGPGVAMKIAKEDMIAELQQAGFFLEKEHDFLPYQYFLEFRPASQ